MKRFWATVVALGVVASLGCAEDARQGNGLETGGGLGLRVVVDDLSADAVAIGLNGEALALRCAQELAAAGLEVLDEQAWQQDPQGSELRVTVSVRGYRYSCAVQFLRRVSYVAGGVPYQTMAPVWSRATEDAAVSQLSYTSRAFFNWNRRSHEPGARVGHSAYVVDSMVGLVDAFCAAFREANPR